jgi:hypothetical protein
LKQLGSRGIARNFQVLDSIGDHWRGILEGRWFAAKRPALGSCPEPVW